MSVVSYAEALTYLGKTTSVTASQEGLLNMILPFVERSISYLFGIDTFEQETITEYYPRTNFGGGDAQSLEYDVAGGQAVPIAVSRGRRSDLVLQRPLRSITTLYEDRAAHFGQQSGDFATASLLTEGTHYKFAITQAGICQSGRVIRIGRGWPAEQGTIKVTYVHGYTAAEMNNGGIGAHIKSGMLHMVAKEFNETLRVAQSGGADIESERLGDYSVKYAAGGGSAVAVPKEVQRVLGFEVNYDRFI